METGTILSRIVQAHRSYGLLIALIIVGTGFALAAPSFATTGNLFAMLHAMGPSTLAAVGMALVILTGKIDISIGSNAFLSASLGALMMEAGYSPLLSFAVILASGTLLGAINGFLVAYLRINSLIATLGTMMAFRGLGLMLTNARVIALPESVSPLSNLMIGPIFFETIIMLAIVSAVHIVHRLTSYGRTLTAVGNGEDVAAKIGLDTRRTVFSTFALAGLLAACSASTSFIQVGSISGFLGKGLEFNAIAIAVVGGISLAGGRGKIVPGVLIGAAAFQVISNGLNQISADPYIYQLVTGAVIFVAMYMDAFKRPATR
ncbi:ABC transporter permease [Brucella pseudogrignonensis]|uniref:ABC transporter permease n=1 Tax=Brucella pseudogrignonensis TaxID=419475 RepID=UPI0028BC4002|nr:ABC transporter permease [Brucella pseudogrignonensis]MDT6942433.1 ABC transporter permease [Brucella pseudogrignonensis]